MSTPTKPKPKPIGYTDPVQLSQSDPKLEKAFNDLYNATLPAVIDKVLGACSVIAEIDPECDNILYVGFKTRYSQTFKPELMVSRIKEHATMIATAAQLLDKVAQDCRPVQAETTTTGKRKMVFKPAPVAQESKPA